MSAVAERIQRTDHLSALPHHWETPRETGKPASLPRLVMVDNPQEFRLEMERVGTGDPPSLMLWGEE